MNGTQGFLSLSSSILNNPNGTITIKQTNNSTQNTIQTIDQLSPLAGNLDETNDKILIYDDSTGLHTYTTASVINAPEVFRSNLPLVGVAPPPYKVGIDYSTGTQYYVNTSGNWTAFPPSTTVFVTDLPNGKVNINASLGGSQDSIRPIDELTPLATINLVDKIPILQGTNHQSATVAQLRQLIAKPFRSVQNLVVGSQVITHNLGLTTPFATIVQTRDNLTGTVIDVRVVSETANNVTIVSPVATTNTRITIFG